MIANTVWPRRPAANRSRTHRPRLRRHV